MAAIIVKKMFTNILIVEKPAKATSLFIVRLIMMTFSMCILN